MRSTVTRAPFSPSDPDRRLGEPLFQSLQFCLGHPGKGAVAEGQDEGLDLFGIGRVLDRLPSDDVCLPLRPGLLLLLWLDRNRRRRKPALEVEVTSHKGRTLPWRLLVTGFLADNVTHFAEHSLHGQAGRVHHPT